MSVSTKSKSAPIIRKLDLVASFNLSDAQARALLVLRLLSSTYANHSALADTDKLKDTLAASLARIGRADIALVNGSLPGLRSHVRTVSVVVTKSTFGADVEVCRDTAAMRALSSILEGADKALAALKAHRLATSPSPLESAALVSAKAAMSAAGIPLAEDTAV